MIWLGERRSFVGCSSVGCCSSPSPGAEQRSGGGHPTYFPTDDRWLGLATWSSRLAVLRCDGYASTEYRLVRPSHRSSVSLGAYRQVPGRASRYVRLT